MSRSLSRSRPFDATERTKGHAPDRVPRIVHVISTPEGVGGAERVLAQVISGGAERGYEQLVLNPFTRTATNPALQKLCGDVPYAARACAHLGNLPPVMAWLNRRLEAFAPDIVHAHLFHALVTVAASRRPTGAWRLVSHHHGDHFRESGRLLHQRLDRSAGARFDRVVAISQFVRDFLVEEYHYDSTHVRLIMNGWDGCPEKGNGTAAVPTIVCTANFRPQKDHMTLLEALRLVRGTVPNAQLLLVGAGTLETELRRRAREMGLEANVRFVGSVENVWPYLGQAHVFALASRYEPLGIAVLEAMAAGLPVVATAVGGIPELVRPNVTGELVVPGDARGMAGHLTRLLQEHQRREKMGIAARADAANHTAAEMVGAYFALYHELLSNGRGAGSG